MSGGVLVVHNLNGDVLLEIKEEDVMWPADDESHVLSASDVMVFLGIGKKAHAFFDLIPMMPAGLTSESMLVDDDIVHWGQSCILHHRRCPRCPLCLRPCERVGVHRLCCHRSGDPNTKEMLHLWHICNDQRPGPSISIQGYVNGVGLKYVFPEDDIDEELCQLCGELNIPHELREEVRSWARYDTLRA